MLDQAGRLVLGAIDEPGTLGERHPNPEFFLKTSTGRLHGGLARPGMPATGVRPTRREVVLRIGTSLQKKLVLCIENEDREGAMELSFAMRIDLAGGADDSVLIVDEDDLFGGIALRGPFQVIGRKGRYDLCAQAGPPAQRVISTYRLRRLDVGVRG